MRKILYTAICGLIIISSMTNNIINNDTKKFSKHDNQYISHNYVKNNANNSNILVVLRKQYIVKKVDETPENIFIISSYDLTTNSCSKSRGDKGFGITKTGINLKNKLWKDIKIVSVDPKVIPLRVKVRLVFLDPEYHKYNSEYLTGDTGNKVKNNRIDMFLGDYSSNMQAKEFGVTTALVTILPNGE